MGTRPILIVLLASFLWTAEAFAFPDTSVLDTFTGTNDTSPPNGSWTNAEMRDGTGGCDLEDNAVAPGTTTLYRGCYYSAVSFAADSEVYGTIVNTGSTSFWGLCVRVANPGTGTTDGYCVETEDAGDTFKINRLDDTIVTQLGATITPGGAVTVGDKFGLKTTGDQICAWWNDDSTGWVELGCRTDSTYTAGGFIGLYLVGDETVGALDDFGGGDSATSGGAQQWRRRH